MRPRSQFEAIGQLVPRVLRELGLDAPARVVRIAESWEAAVGPEIARHCQPRALRDGRLEVSVGSSVWAQQLQLRVPEILEALRGVLGDDAPADLWFRVG